MASGVYEIVNLVNGKIYIGSSQDLDGRKNKHFRMLRSNTHHCKHLQNSFNAYKEKCFEFRVLEYCNNYLEREQYYLDNTPIKYNSCKDAIAPMKGRKHTEESKQKMSRKGKEHPWYGKKHSEESKVKMSNSLEGKFSGEKNPRCKYKYEDFDEVKALLSQGMKAIEISKITGISRTEISKIKNGRHWSCREVNDNV